LTPRPFAPRFFACIGWNGSGLKQRRMMMTNSYPTYAEIQDQCRRRLEAAKAPLIEVLKALGVSTVAVDYDGESDSGQINDILALDINQARISLAEVVPVSISEVWGEPVGDTLEAFVETFAWDALGYYHDGFEIDGGGFGTLTINVGEAKIVIDHNDRIVDVVPAETEF
jgi:hypothetical protein